MDLAKSLCVGGGVALPHGDSTCPPRPPNEPTHARSESTGSDSAATVAAPAPAAGPWRRSGNGPSRRSRECLFTARAVNSASPPRNLRAGRADACLALPARVPSQTLPRTLTRTSRIATRRRRSGANVSKVRSHRSHTKRPASVLAGGPEWPARNRAEQTEHRVCLPVHSSRREETPFTEQAEHRV